jgi:hypothetical protein
MFDLGSGLADAGEYNTRGEFSVDLRNGLNLP